MAVKSLGAEGTEESLETLALLASHFQGRMARTRVEDVVLAQVGGEGLHVIA